MKEAVLYGVELALLLFALAVVICVIFTGVVVPIEMQIAAVAAYIGSSFLKKERLFKAE